ncbi:thermonuclease family protein [Mesorhizobium silamurunense]|uniref:thermonuclease family protein n=1 Tax=Mesorhizobium silamurunense TaxID=499528 RepID=UPI001FEE5752|nr:thermonuclease family protein [Mesorhizobium silamurunense]
MTLRFDVGARMTLLAIAVAVAPQASAQSPSIGTPGLYRPNQALQTPPLRVEVLDGTRLRDIETRAIYRLVGIDTCAPDQTALLGRQPWPCGTMAAAWLVRATLNKWVACNILRDENGEHLARCAAADHADIGADMVRDGVAVTAPPTERDPSIRAYASAEQEARKAYRGLWSSTFQMPWEFRGSPQHRAIAAIGQQGAP